MQLDSPAMKLVRAHLEAAILAVEAEAAERRYNTLCIRALGNAAMVLGQQRVADRAAQLLWEAPDEAFWSGAITNIDLPKTIPERLRQIDAPDELEAQHPPYCKEYIMERVRSYAQDEEHIALCIEGRLQEARRIAGSGTKLEEVSMTLAVLGEFDAALDVARDPALESVRQKDAQFVLALELFRSGRLDESQAILAELDPNDLGPWDRILLALGLGDREPWGGYPYPDW